MRSNNRLIVTHCQECDSCAVTLNGVALFDSVGSECVEQCLVDIFVVDARMDAALEETSPSSEREEVK